MATSARGVAVAATGACVAKNNSEQAWSEEEKLVAHNGGAVIYRRGGSPLARAWRDAVRFKLARLAHKIKRVRGGVATSRAAFANGTRKRHRASRAALSRRRRQWAPYDRLAVRGARHLVTAPLFLLFAWQNAWRGVVGNNVLRVLLRVIA